MARVHFSSDVNCSPHPPEPWPKYVLAPLPDGQPTGFRWRSGPPRRHPPGPYQWPRPGHEECACHLGYGPMARLKLEQQAFLERLDGLEEVLGEQHRAEPSERTRTQPPRRPAIYEQAGRK